MAAAKWRLQMLRWRWAMVAWNASMVVSIASRHGRLCWRWWHLPSVIILAVSQAMPTLEVVAESDDG